MGDAYRAVRKKLFLLATGLLWFSLFTYVSLLTPYVEGLGASHATAGLIVGSFGFIQLLIRLPLGYASDMLRRRRLFISLGFAFSFLSALGFLWSRDLGVVLVSRILAGVAAANWVHFNVLYSGYFRSEETSRAVGTLNSVAMAAQTLALFAGGVIADALSMPAVFALGGAAAIVGFFVSLGLTEKREPGPARMPKIDFAAVFMNSRLLTIAAFAIIIQILTYAVTFGFISVYAKERFGASGSAIALLSVIATIAGAFSSLAGHTPLVRRFREMPLLLAGLLVAALASVLTPLAPDLMLLSAVQLVSGLGRGLAFTMAMSLALTSVPADRRATAMGFYQASYGLGMVAGPVIMGLLSDIGGLAFGFVGIGTVTAVLAGLTALLYRSSSIPGQGRGPGTAGPPETIEPDPF